LVKIFFKGYGGFTSKEPNIGQKPKDVQVSADTNSMN